jgi:HTH-type transcriptional regulator/antitoxin HigA
MSSTSIIRPILNDADLKAAEERLDVVFDAEPGTTEGIEAEYIIALIQTYERDIDVSPRKTNAKSFSDYLVEWNLEPVDTAKHVGGSANASHLVKGTRRLSVGRMKRLHEAYGMPYDQLMKFAADSSSRRQAKGEFIVLK